MNPSTQLDLAQAEVFYNDYFIPYKKKIIFFKNIFFRKMFVMSYVASVKFHTCKLINMSIVIKQNPPVQKISSK